MASMREICDDLAAEHEALDELVANLDETGLDTPTSASGWSVRDQVSHLWFFDQRALLALTDPDEFVADAARLMASGGTEASVRPGREMTGVQLLARWRHDRKALIDLARGVEESTRVPWYGPAMGARSFVTARLMETWAHGQDVADALGCAREPTDRLRHVAHIGVRARPFSYVANGLTMPDVDVHVALTTPSGETAVWGPPNDANVVSGPMLDFCLVVTQRRHHADTALDIDGDAAREWMSIAQAFAGPPGPGRRPGQFG
jgi:uncharacterized protein (TIGR03084 family)